MKLRRQVLPRFSILLLLAIAILTLPIIGGAQGKTAFTSYRDGNLENYIMNPDGSAQTKAGTQNIRGNISGQLQKDRR